MSLRLRFWEYWRFEVLFHIQWLSLGQSLCFNTIPRSRKGSIQQLLRLQKYKRRGQTHLRPSNFFKPRRPFGRPYCQWSRQLWPWRFRGSRRSTLRVSKKLLARGFAVHASWILCHCWWSRVCTFEFRSWCPWGFLFWWRCQSWDDLRPRRWLWDRDKLRQRLPGLQMAVWRWGCRKFWMFPPECWGRSSFRLAWWIQFL
jgi:hypothetical protein